MQAISLRPSLRAHKMNVLRGSDIALRSFVVVSWAVYALTFFPFTLPKEYWFQWGFALVALFGLLFAGISAFRGTKTWTRAAVTAAGALLVVYLWYWLSVTEIAREMRPTLAWPISFGHILSQAAALVGHFWSREAYLAALQTLYFELAMPIAQLVLLGWVAVRQGRK